MTNPPPSAARSLMIRIPERRDGTGGSWELTWPIWHLLPHRERQRIASSHGMRIGEFEEFVSLQTAVDDSLPETGPSVEVTNTVSTPSSNWVTDAEEDDEDDVGEASSSDVIVERLLATSRSTQVEEPCSDLVKEGGFILMLPDELVHRVFDYLDVHMYALCAKVHRTWNSFTRTESTYRRICERSYLHQSKHKVLNIQRWKTFHNMLCGRPRLRTGGGLYVLKYSHIKKIQRDMWTEVPVGAILETTYYRYLLFEELNGKVLYALTPTSPLEMIPKFVQFRQQQANKKSDLTCTSNDKRILIGHYQVHRRTVRVRAQYAWSHIQMQLSICETSQTYRGARFGQLSLQQHQTSVSGTFTGHDVTDYEVPSEYFRFLTDVRL